MVRSAPTLLLAGCVEPRASDHEAIEVVLSPANIGFEVGDPDLFAGAFAADAISAR